MQIKTTQTSLRTIKQGDPKFNIIDGVTIVPRAAIEISSGCPQNFKHLIEQCVMQGWIKPIAHIKDTELFWEEFSK